MRNEHHPFLRPFDIYTRAHKTDVGRVTFFLLAAGRQWPLLVPMSVSVSARAGIGDRTWLGGKKIIIFPGWGPGKMTKGWYGEGRTLVNVHHLTIAPEKGKIKTHITQARTGHSDPWRESKKIPLRTGEAVIAASLFVKRPQALDLAGTAITSFEAVRGIGASECERQLSACLSNHHPILELPAGPTWDEDHHLRINILLTPGTAPVEKDYPVLFGPFPSLMDGPVDLSGKGEMRQTKVPITPTANLILAHAILPGKLKKDLYMF